MTTLRIDHLALPTAALGEENPLPPLFGTGNDLHQADMSAAPEAIRAGSAYGRVSSVAPYLLQDDYGRDREIREHPVAVLENEHLRATFLLGAGGRLWSLIDLATGRELVFRNEVLQPANLALRNAWFAGGVEWNVGTIGHTMGTFSPIHAARVQTPDGEPFLRMWEWDRIRSIVYQIDAHLPAGATMLRVHVRLVNRADVDVPTYWWSNMAVAQTDGTRVITCADEAWSYGYTERLETVPVTDPARGVDVSYPGRGLDAADYFFDTEGATHPWIVAVDEAGTGLAQRSTAPLRGRKLFLWGRGAGGERWQEWLCGAGQRYLEIQAGLARTQFEHVRLPARDELSWTEAYGRVNIDPQAAHGSWDVARGAAQQAVDALAGAAELDSFDVCAEDWSRLPIAELLHLGSGWGELEVTRGALRGFEAELAATPFPAESRTVLQQDWIDLLDDGRFPLEDPSSFPRSMQIDARWEGALAAGAGWADAALLGSLRAARGDLEGARAAWIRSVDEEPNALALRNLGALARHQGDLGEAVRRYEESFALAPRVRALAVETIDAHVAAGEPQRALAMIDGLDDAIRMHPRVRLLEAIAAIEVDPDRAGVILATLEVADLREGEARLHEVWWDYRTAVRAWEQGVPADAVLRAQVVRDSPVPPSLDFRMVTERPQESTDPA